MTEQCTLDRLIGLMNQHGIRIPDVYHYNGLDDEVFQYFGYGRPEDPQQCMYAINKLKRSPISLDQAKIEIYRMLLSQQKGIEC